MRARETEGAVVLVIEICLVVITLCVLAVTIGLAVAFARAVPLANKLSALSDDASTALQRMHGVLGELEAMVRDARATESRVTGAVRGIVDRLAPPITELATVIGGTAQLLANLARLVPGLGALTGLTGRGGAAPPRTPESGGREPL